MREEFIRLSITILVSILSGAAAGYYASLFTDQRKEIKKLKAEKKRYLTVFDMMPELLREMKEDLEQVDCSTIREFFICRENASINSTSKRFYYNFEKHENLKNKIDVLENNGYVTDVTPGNTPIYRMTENFVTHIIKTKI